MHRIKDGEATFGMGTFLFDTQVHSANGLPGRHRSGTVQEFVERGPALVPVSSGTPPSARWCVVALG